MDINKSSKEKRNVASKIAQSLGSDLKSQADQKKIAQKGNN